MSLQLSCALLCSSAVLQWALTLTTSLDRIVKYRIIPSLSQENRERGREKKEGGRERVRRNRGSEKKKRWICTPPSFVYSSFHLITLNIPPKITTNIPLEGFWRYRAECKMFNCSLFKELSLVPIQQFPHAWLHLFCTVGEDVIFLLH